MIDLNEQLSETEQTIESRYKLFMNTKNKSTQGRLKIVDNNVFINLSNVLTVPGRFVTEEEQKANMALWVLVKDDMLVEDLWILQRSYKLGYERVRFKYHMSVIVVVFLLIVVFLLTWMIFKFFNN